ncbi:MAG: LPS assembly lipoprotein LptE [Limnobacter sp.]|nr:LPS assembly lipoprotein LptE [Limnobacter sp.]
MIQKAQAFAYKANLSNLLKPLTLVFLSLVLASCGFQLRGQFNFGFDTLNRRGMDNTDMSRTMDMQLEINQLKVNTNKNAPITLDLLGERRDRDIVTFSATGRAREVRIIYSLKFQVRDRNGDYLIAPTELSQRRELTYNDNQILGKEAEEIQLYQEMQKDIARLILTRLSAISMSSATPAATPAAQPASGPASKPAPAAGETTRRRITIQ